ncbi:MAG: hypothetical protein A2138_10500 [Deltaproteobacteria bacterium RBG_16_71_12]|nr:MAG: hypothetical protein A2138_10500 [Deltaproteobacteria bacterium RBG_16_71_12]
MSDEGGALHEVARLVATCERLVWLTGAGLSVASGLSPYRKSGDAVWSRFITEWGTIERFHEEPAAWWREFWLKAHADLAHGRPIAPNAGHEAITRMVAGRPEHLVVTQNIDGLHRKSGVPEQQLVEIHGRHDRFVCTRQGCARVSQPFDAVDLSRVDEGVVPRCDACGEPLRPLVLLFDETYDSHPAYGMRQARRALNDAEVIVFVGTSFSVGITDYAVRAGRYAGARLINVNVEAVGEPGFLNLLGPAEATLPALSAMTDPA